MIQIPIPDPLVKASGALRSLWLALMLRADENGCLKTSVRELEIELEYSTQKVRTLLEKLISNKLINKTVTKQVTNLTICDYESLMQFSKTEKQTSNKPRNKSSTNRKAVTQEYVSPGFVAEEYKETWRKFVTYRREIKKPYLSESTERIAYEKMVNMSGNNPEVARDMVDRSILGQWQGLYLSNDGKQNGDRHDPRRGTDLAAQSENDYKGSF